MTINAYARWTEKEKFVGAVAPGPEIVIDASSERTAPSPMDLVLIGLCSCTAVDVVNILTKKREPFTSVEVAAEAEKAPTSPKVYTKIKLIYRIGGKVNRKSVDDAVRLSVDKYCSVEAMLKKSAEITFEIILV
jgi:putative redox protein